MQAKPYDRLSLVLPFYFFERSEMVKNLKILFDLSFDGTFGIESDKKEGIRKIETIKRNFQ
jgi:hypothetical protein